MEELSVAFSLPLQQCWTKIGAGTWVKKQLKMHLLQQRSYLRKTFKRSQMCAGSKDTARTENYHGQDSGSRAWVQLGAGSHGTSHWATQLLSVGFPANITASAEPSSILLRVCVSGWSLSDRRVGLEAFCSELSWYCFCGEKIFWSLIKTGVMWIIGAVVGACRVN